jgi:hypothetical protein
MQTKIIEAVEKRQFNWGKFMLCRFDKEWGYQSALNQETVLCPRWDRRSLLVMDLETGEGAIFMPGGLARADLNKHSIWVCPLFESFLAWLYAQDLSDLNALPALVSLGDVPTDMYGYRRSGDGRDGVSGNHADAMIAHRFFEALLGESARGRDFAIKVPMAEEYLNRLQGHARKLQEGYDSYAALNADKTQVIGKMLDENAILLSRIAELEAERDRYKLCASRRRDAANNCGNRLTELKAENVSLRKLLDEAPHDPACHSVRERHLPGATHYETDAGEPCPAYHYRFGPCDCWKSRIPKREEETA